MTTTGLDSSDRFDDRVADYVRYRPGYPDAAIELLARELGLGAGRVVADVGAGTGILSRPLATTGAHVIAVDPNERMLDAAREYLAGSDVEIVVGTAEATGLDDQSVDAITAGQAFHWFETEGTRREFERILRPGGKVALIWNSKAFSASPFLDAYEALLLELAPEFERVRHEKSGGEDEIRALYGGDPDIHTFAHAQHFDWDGVRGRVLSSSYVPNAGDPAHEAFVAGLRRVFDEHAMDGEIEWPYTTKVYVGALD